MKTLSFEEILERIPQQAPFRFVDEILAVDENRIVGKYTFREDEFFYKGHFPGRPITPGVILLESMGQIGLVAHAAYLTSLEKDKQDLLIILTDIAVEFLAPVLPGDTIVIESKKVFWRMNKIRAIAEAYCKNILVASCTMSGVGVKK